MKKERVSIRFTSLTSLWGFRTEIEANVFEMNMSQITITCECTPANIELAINKYRGKLAELKIEGEQSNCKTSLQGKQSH